MELVACGWLVGGIGDGFWRDLGWIGGGIGGELGWDFK